MGNSDPMVVFAVQLLGFVTYLASFLLSVIGFLASIATSIPVLIIALVIASVMIPVVEYDAQIVNHLEHFMRTVVYPFYESTARPIMNAFRRLFNPTICFVDAYQLWAYSIIWDAIYPTLVDCEGLDTAFRFGEFLFQFFGDFVVDYFFQLKFFNEQFDYTTTCAAWIKFYLAYETSYCCSCTDLCLFLVKAPFPLSPVSGQFADPETCAAAGDALNVIMQFLDVILTLIWDVLSSLVTWTWNINRPDLYQATLIASNATFHLANSYDNAFQAFWDEFIVFYKMDFDGYFTIFAEYFTIVFKVWNFVYTGLINIDQLISFPTNRFLTTTMKYLITDIANMIAAPAQFPVVQIAPTVISVGFNITNYYVDPNSTITPLDQPNVNYGRPRATYSACLFINRTICNPNDPTTSCFGTTYAQFLQGINPCCVTDFYGGMITNIATGIFESVTHLDSWAHFFTYADNQPFTHALRDTIINGASCALQVLRFIPDGFGLAVQNLLTRAVQWYVSMWDLVVHVVTGIITLPYFLFALPGTDNYITNYTEWITEFVNIQQTLVDTDDSTSFINSVSFLLNNGLPVPPIPCLSCVPSGFLPVDSTFSIPVGGAKRYDTVQDILGMPKLSDQSHRVTPLIHYGREYPTNPWDIGHMLWLNAKDIVGSGVVPFPTHQSINQYFDKKRAVIAERWNRVKKCQEAKRVEWTLKKEHPHEWMKRHRNGDFKCDPNESLFERTQYEYVDYIPGPIPLIFENCTNPTPPCFDLACLPRSLLLAFVNVITLYGGIINGVFQYNPLFQLPVPTVSEFPYFTGELCRAPWSTRCFQTDILNAATNVLRVPYCLCNMITLLIPITLTGRQQPRICEVIVAGADFIASGVQVIVNTVMCLVLGGTDEPQHYAYFAGGFFDSDINQQANYALAVVARIADLVRDFFPFINQANFDPGCLVEVLASTYIEILRGIIITGVSLGTMILGIPQQNTGLPAVCWFRLDTDLGCPGTLDEIGIVKQFGVILDILLPNPASHGCKRQCNGTDPGVGGVSTCICEIVNSLLPWRQDPNKPVSCELPNVNCMNIDFCCPVVKAGIFLKNAGNFLSRGIVSIWQPWYNYFPQFTVNYLFCSERSETPGLNCSKCDYENQFAPPVPSCVLGNGTVVICGTFTCGKMNILVENLVNPTDGLLACVCPYLNILDSVLSYFFQLVSNNWEDCFCGRKYGIVPSILNVWRQIAFTLLDLVRKSTLACYWQPSNAEFEFNSVTGLCQPKQSANLYDPTNSFVYRVFSPWANALCITYGNIACVLNSVFFLSEYCIEPGARMLGGFVGWAFKYIYQIAAFFEGFIAQFTEEQPICAGEDTTCAGNYGTTVFSGQVGANQLAAIITPLLTLPLDSALADSQIACTTICPKFSSWHSKFPNACQCYDVAHSTRGTYQTNVGVPKTTASVWEPVLVFDALGNIVNMAVQQDARAAMSNELFKGKGRYFPKYASYLGEAGIWKARKTSVDVMQYVCRSIKYPDASSIPDSSWWAPAYQWIATNNGTGIYLPPCINVADWDWALAGPYPDPRFLSSCNKNGFCRPDNLPTCGLSQEDMLNASPDEKIRDPIRALDGQVMAFIRFVSCAVSSIASASSGQDQLEFSTGTSDIIYPLEVFDSMAWQILAGFIDVWVALIVFMLSFLLALANTNCSCYRGTDQSQVFLGKTAFNATTPTFTYTNKGAIDQVLIVGAIDYCYGCPLGDTQNCGCWYDAPTQELQGWMPCAAHCPYYSLSTVNCVAILQALLVDRQQGNTFLRSQTLPGNVSLVDACSGLINGVQVVNASQYDNGLYGKAAFCPAPQCQFVNVTQVDPYQRPGFWYHRDANDGSGPYCCGCNYYNDAADYHFFQCGIFGIVNSFLNLIAAFISIFTKQYWIPDGLAKRGDNITANGPVRRRESWFDMTCRTGISMQRNNKSPNAMDNFFSVFYDYDTTDCYHDPTTCVCRNLYLPDVCYWNNDTVVVRENRPRRARTPHDTRTLPADEIVDVVADRFDGNTLCDHVAREMTSQTWSNVSYHHKIQWVDCVDQRIQSERISALRPDIIPNNVVYTRGSPFVIYQNIREGIANHFTAHHEKAIYYRRLRSQERRDSKFATLHVDLKERRKLMAKALMDQLPADSPLFESMLHFDGMWYKYQRGYYGYLYDKVVARIKNRQFSGMPTVIEAKAHLDEKLAAFGQTIMLQQYGILLSATANSMYTSARVVRDAVAAGPIQYMRDAYHSAIDGLYKRAVRKRDVKNERIQRFLDQTPLYQWFKDPKRAQFNTSAPSSPGIISGFMAHLNRVIAHNRNVSSLKPLNAWNADMHVSVLKQHVIHMFTPQVTPFKSANWFKLKRVGYQLYNIAFPGSLTRRQHERYIFGDTCILLNRVEVITNSLLSYCVNEFVDNIDATRLPQFAKSSMPRLANFSRSMTLHNENAFHHERNLAKYELVVPKDPHAWKRRRFIYPTEARVRDPHVYVDYRVAKRIAASDPPPYQGPGGWNFYTWILSVIKDFINAHFGIQANTFLDDIRYWLLNPNVSEADYPNVGLRYWVMFWVRCRWPDNLNCSKGVGLLNAFWWVTLGVVIAVFIGSYIVPPFLWIFALFGTFFLWIMLIGAVGIHYSPACLRIYPNFNDFDGMPISNLGLGFNVALPMCLADIVLNFTDTYITNCYVPLIIPSYMVNGIGCPTNPDEYIDFVSCQTVGVSDGIQNVLYFCYTYLGGWALDLINALANVTIGLIVPGVNTYFQNTIQGFRSAGPTQQQRENFCFFFTLPAIALPSIFLYVSASLIGVVLPFFLLFLFQIWYLLEATPILSSLPGYDSNYDEDDVDITPLDFSKVPRSAITAESLARWIRYQENAADVSMYRF